jgi:hypothetical protein
MVDSIGNIEWSINGVNVHLPTIQHERYPKISQNNKGGAIISWVGYGDGKTRVQSLDSFGMKQWVDIGVNTFGTYGDINSMVYGCGVTNSYAAQRVDSTGDIKWGNGILLHADTTGGQFGSVSDTFGNLFVVWDELRNNPNYDDQYVQKIDTNGIIKWGNRGVAVCTLQTGYETYPQIASDGLGGAICTWFGDPNHSWNHVWVQRIYPDGHGVSGNPVQNEVSRRPDLKCYPNPYSTGVGIYYDLSSDDYVSLAIYNMLGQLVKTLVRQKQSSGRHEIKWHGDDDAGKPISAGIYFVTITYGRFVKSQKIIKLK